MDSQENRRENNRIEVPHRRMQVYTSLTSAAYTVDIENLSKEGAFLRTQHLPELNETISFNLCSPMYEFYYSGNATVKRIVKKGNEDEWGFAVEFDKSIVDQEYKHIIQ